MGDNGKVFGARGGVSPTANLLSFVGLSIFLRCALCEPESKSRARGSQKMQACRAQSDKISQQQAEVWLVMNRSSSRQRARDRTSPKNRRVDGWAVAWAVLSAHCVLMKLAVIV